ncbi:MAG: molybdenum cofactor biosynthesis protein MoaE [Proteobacteria bacterium]|nr:molybdenum cofactor biosynthesis protein MoaE [Pseudomonadota bacterium]
MKRFVSIQTEDFSIEQETNQLRAATPEVGGIATFTGLVSDLNREQKIESLFLEHYPGMTEKQLEQIIDQAQVRWNLLGARVIHRVGLLYPQDQIVFVGVSSRHRKECFEACQFIMDYLKTHATIWKKERGDEQSEWLEARESDKTDEKKWQQ